MIYTRQIQIEFNHCDPAGIVFYPRYFEMTNSVVENFFNDVVGRSFASMHFGADNGVPTVAIEANFMAPSRLGDMEMFSLEVTKVGRSSVAMTIEARLGEELRMRTDLTLVWIAAMKAAPWPAEMHGKLLKFMEDAA